MEAKTLVATIFAIIAVVSLVGNTFVVVVFLKNRVWLKKVHTCLLLALAIQDILIAICLLTLPEFGLTSGIYKLPTYPTHQQLFCSLIWSSYIAFALSVVSTYTCFMLAIDRSLAVLKPTIYKRFCHSRKCIATMVIFSWIAGFGFEIRTALNVESLRLDDGSHVCTSKIHSSVGNTVTVVFMHLGKVILPAVLMTIGYVKMVMKLRKLSSRVSRGTHELNSNSFFPRRSKNKAYYSLERLTRMVCAASAIVVICWLPDQLYFSLYELHLIELDESIHDGLHVLGFMNTCVNPFLYSFSHYQYKEEFKNILVCRENQQRSRRRQQNVTANHSLEEIRLRLPTAIPITH